MRSFSEKIVLLNPFLNGVSLTCALPSYRVNALTDLYGVGAFKVRVEKS
ncbi:MAG: hypothetical protein AAGI90_05220 [Chlamydiota bacterium]